MSNVGIPSSRVGLVRRMGREGPSSCGPETLASSLWPRCCFWENKNQATLGGQDGHGSFLVSSVSLIPGSQSPRVDEHRLGEALWNSAWSLPFWQKGKKKKTLFSNSSVVWNRVRFDSESFDSRYNSSCPPPLYCFRLTISSRWASNTGFLDPPWYQPSPLDRLIFFKLSLHHFYAPKLLIPDSQFSVKLNMNSLFDFPCTIKLSCSLLYL